MFQLLGILPDPRIRNKPDVNAEKLFWLKNNGSYALTGKNVFSKQKISLDRPVSFKEGQNTFLFSVMKLKANLIS
jgi:hypothetical protein